MKRILCSLLVAALPFGSVLAQSDNRTVVADRHARYFGTELREESLVPGGKARIGQASFEAWFRQSNESRWSTLEGTQS